MSANLRKVFGGVVLTILWICCFLFIRPTLVIDFGGGLIVNFKFTVVLIGLLIIVFYHILYRASTEATKLSLTTSLSIAWLALIFFYPFNDPANILRGAVGFFTLVGGLAVSVLWVRFFSDEISTE